MKERRIVKLLTVFVVLAAMLLTGCGGTEEAVKEETAQSSESESSESAVEALAKEAAPVIQLIKAIGEVTLESGEALQAASEAYNELSEEAKQYVTNVEDLLADVEKYSRLRIEHAQELIDAIPSVVTEAEREAVEQARKAVDELSAAEREAVDTAKLEEAVKALQALKEESQNELLAEEAAQQIEILDFYCTAPDANSNVRVYLNFTNVSGKTMETIRFEITFYDKDGEIVLARPDEAEVNECIYEGTIAPGEGLTGTDWMWSGYESEEIDSVKMVRMIIEYTDGTSYEIKEDVLKELME